MDMFKKFFSYNVFLHLVVAALAVEVYILATQNKELKTRLSDPNRNLPELLKEGDSVPPFSMLILEGKEETIAYKDSTKAHR